MSVMFVGAIIALIVVVSALGGSQMARRWAIGMYCLLAAAGAAYYGGYYNNNCYDAYGNWICAGYPY